MTARRKTTRLVIVYYFYRKRVKQCFVFSLRNKCDNCIGSPDQLISLLLYLLYAHGTIQLFVIHVIILQNAAPIFDRDAAGLFNIIVQNFLILY
jgi:hypothetical protein